MLPRVLVLMSQPSQTANNALLNHSSAEQLISRCVVLTALQIGRIGLVCIAEMTFDSTRKSNSPAACMILGSASQRRLPPMSAFTIDLT